MKRIGVEKALELLPDIILMDMQMPVMDGYEASKSLRESNYTKPIIALTANSMTEQQERSRDSGCDDFVSKPFKSDQLIKKVTEYLKK